MTKTLRWQLYVTGYTFLLGLPLLAVPDKVIPLIGFVPTTDPWGGLMGMFLLSLSYLSFAIYREKAISLLFHTIVVRTFIAVVLLMMAFYGQLPVLYALAAIVGIGVVGSLTCYARERRDSRDRIPR